MARPSEDRVPLNVRVPRELLAAFDKAAGVSPTRTRTVAVETLMRRVVEPAATARSATSARSTRSSTAEQGLTNRDLAHMRATSDVTPRFKK